MTSKTVISKQDIENLAMLVRLELTENEKDKFAEDISHIVEYLDDLQAVEVKEEMQVGDVYNKLRDDINPHEPAAFTEEILAIVPEREGQYVKVPKVLHKDKNVSDE